MTPSIKSWAEKSLGFEGFFNVKQSEDKKSCYHETFEV
jgi:hypothetical protein